MSDNISEATLIRILKHLPVRTILRFRTVCKGWKSLLDSDQFMHAHLALQNPQFLLQFPDEPHFSSVEPRSPPFARNLTTPFQGQSIQAVGTLHGVVCLYEKGRKFRIWNPSIRKFSSIPLPLHAECYHSQSFWIDPSTKKFKIILMAITPGTLTQRVNGVMYSSNRRAWTVIPHSEFLQRWFASSVSGYAVVIAGIAHWNVCYNLGHRKVSVIVCFDFTQECFEFIEMPYDGEIMQWQGMLSVLEWSSASCQILMREQGSWIRVFSFDVKIPKPDYSSMLMLGVTEEVFWALIRTQPEMAVVEGRTEFACKLRWYDTSIGYIPFVSDNIYCSLAYDFVESILFP